MSPRHEVIRVAGALRDLVQEYDFPASATRRPQPPGSPGRRCNTLPATERRVYM